MKCRRMEWCKEQYFVWESLRSISISRLSWRPESAHIQIISSRIQIQHASLSTGRFKVLPWNWVHSLLPTFPCGCKYSPFFTDLKGYESLNRFLYIYDRRNDLRAISGRYPPRLNTNGSITLSCLHHAGIISIGFVIYLHPCIYYVKNIV